MTKLLDRLDGLPKSVTYAICEAEVHPRLENIAEQMQTLYKAYGDPRIGCYRVTFIGDDYVIKVPYNNHGIECNIKESEWDDDKVPLASCELIDGIPGFVSKLLKMEKLTPVPGATHVRSYSPKFEYPSWVNCIDGYQCGYNAAGDLVAFDL